MILLAALAAASFAAWVVLVILLARHRRALLPLDPGGSLALREIYPLVSIVVPARDEEEIIESCVRAALAQEHEPLEVVVCDDDSHDGTAAILARIAEEDARLRVVTHRGPPPEGWVGKNHALHLATRAARGAWLLFVDADCVLSPRALPAALARAHGADGAPAVSLVSALPDLQCPDLANRLGMPAFAVWLSVAFPAHRVVDPRCRDALAAGGFLLIERAAHEAIGGFPRLAPHIVEDILTARLVKASGRRIALFLGRACVSTRMYSGWRDLWEGVTKNAFAGADFRVMRSLAGALAIVVLAVAPAASLVALALLALQSPTWGGAEAVALAGFGASTAVLVLLHGAIHHEMRIPLVLALAAPVGHAFVALAIVASTMRGRFGRGVSWKGRRYYGADAALPGDRLNG